MSTGAYLKKVAGIYDKKSSVTDILNNFRCITKDYQEFNDNIDNSFNYSSYNYSELSKEEQEAFYKDELCTLETLICNSVYDKSGIVKSFKVVYDLARADAYKDVPKINRKMIFPTASSNRPIGNDSYIYWNGLQVIDLDIKDAEIASKLHKYIADDLCQYRWFLGVCTSASGKGLHVWTKIHPISTSNDTRYVEFKCNFRHKYSFLYMTLCKYAGILGYTKEDIIRYLDMATAKVQQGLFIGYDKDVFLNTNFKDLRLDTDFTSAYNNGVESIDWIVHPDLKDIFAKLDWFNNTEFDNTKNINVSDITTVDERSASHGGPKHYKHSARWQLANTLTSIYGYEKAVEYMADICSGTPLKELRGDVKTASIHNKPISIWAINELNKYHGFNITVNSNVLDSSQQSLVKEDQTNIIEDIDNSNTNKVVFNITKDQYLSDIKDDIISNLSKITLLEAGAGYGKTEMIKALKARTLLILPFTSTIKSKIEKSEVTSDWLYYYGNKRPSFEEIIGNKSMAMTIDKFSKLNVMELAFAKFQYIVFDESHLLFTSSYRNVMSPAIQRLANCPAKVILMTGTPTGELTFFPDIRHIKVIKEDVRVKDFEINFCPGPTELMIEMCKSMANDIIEGRKILYPTNQGNTHYEIITGLIQQELNNRRFSRQLNSFYYKKSNYGDDNMNSINFDKSVGNNDLICCTTYLSVGVDICDKSPFSVYFDDLWISQDIEQFANRLRKNDLYVKMFLPKKNNDGYVIDYYQNKPLDLSFYEEDVVYVRDIIKTVNDLIDRNVEEAKYSPIISNLIAGAPYVVFDENDCKYYVDETAYKLTVYEDRYSAYAKQLPILSKAMVKFGYTIGIINKEKEIEEVERTEVDEYIRRCRKARYNYITDHTLRFLEHINENNIDLYREIQKGNYDIIRSNDDKYVNMRKDHNIYTEDIEILEKNIPVMFSLYKTYELDTIKDIYKYCIDTKTNRINFSKLGRIRRFINIVSSIKKHRLDFPVYKMIVDFKKFAIEHPETTKAEIDTFINNYTVKYANSIPDVVVEDVKFLQKLKELVNELWKVIIVQSNAIKNGIIKISPFELLWQTKTSTSNNYGDAIINQFFVNELIDNIKEDTINELSIDESIELPELEHTGKKKLEEVRPDIPNIVHKDYDYYKYSAEDNSNNRFLAKQERTNSLRDTVFASLEQETTEAQVESDNTLF